MFTCDPLKSPEFKCVNNHDTSAARVILESPMRDANHGLVLSSAHYSFILQVALKFIYVDLHC